MNQSNGITFAVFTILSYFFLCFCMVDVMGSNTVSTNVIRYYCEHRQHKMIEVGYFTHGFHKGRKQYFIKQFHINDGWTTDYCSDGYTRCRVKMPPTLVNTDFVSQEELESHSANLANECVHTHTIKDGELKHVPPKRWGY